MSLGNPAERRQSARNWPAPTWRPASATGAVASLERALAEDPAADELWLLLTQLYRDGEPLGGSGAGAF